MDEFIEIFNQKISKFFWKYPQLKNKINIMDLLNHAKGYGKGLPEEYLFDIFEHLEGFSKWRKDLDERYDHQHLESIEERIEVLEIYIKLLRSENEYELFQLAKFDMIANLLKELEIVRALLPENTVQSSKTKLGVSDIISMNSNNQIPLQSAFDKTVHPIVNNSKQHANINEIKQSHLIWLLYELKLNHKNDPIVTYKKLSAFFKQYGGKPLNPKSFMSALGNGKPKGAPTKNIAKIKSKIKELLL
ncbi:MAG: hypothetical protein IPM69_15390 [Ignavibacteria bacterium]|nr:hypothetical protein [Ignavibacteria bacterium]